MTEPFDLEDLLHLEQTFYDTGYTDGFAHGRTHGLIEGRALGRQKGFEIWEEIGFYEGFARTWRAVCLREPSANDQRPMHHVTRLLDLIGQFPTVNPSSAEKEAGTEVDARCSPLSSEDAIDLSKLQSQIRSRYKTLCASLGVRPTLRAGAAGEDGVHKEDASQGGGGVWTLEGGDDRPTMRDLSF